MRFFQRPITSMEATSVAGRGKGGKALVLGGPVQGSEMQAHFMLAKNALTDAAG